MPTRPLSLQRLRRHPGDALMLGLGLVVTLLGVGLQAWHPMNLGIFLEVNHWGPVLARMWSALCVIGLGSSAFALVGAAGPRAAREMAAMVGLLLLGTLVTQGLKFGLQAPRPLAVLGPGLVEVVGESLRTRSMPSGHAFTAFSVLCTVWLGTARRWEYAVALALVATAIGVSRAAVGAHWPSDVMVGSGLGVVVAVLTWHLAPVRRLASWLLGTNGRRMVAVLLAGTALSLLAGVLPQGLPALGLRAIGYPLALPVQVVIALAGLWGAWRWWRGARPALPAWDHPGRWFHGLAGTGSLTLVGGKAIGQAATPSWANPRAMGRPDFAPQRRASMVTPARMAPVPTLARTTPLNAGTVSPSGETTTGQVWDLDRFRRPQSRAAVDPVAPPMATTSAPPPTADDARPRRLPRLSGDDLARYARPKPVHRGEPSAKLTVDAPAEPDSSAHPADQPPPAR